MGTLLFLTCILFTVAQNCLAADEQSKASGLADGLYATLKSIASPDIQKTPGVVDGRFILLMPGKVLNYFDYYPGAEYSNFIQNLDTSAREAVVPPHVMEKWFDLADTIPDPNPFNAQDSGRSLSSEYSSILHETKIMGLRAKTSSAKALHTQSLNYLNKLVTDPDNTTKQVPRLVLYERYRDSYNDLKLDMEDTIERQRTSVGSLEYELWFQRHYPSLQAKVESMYYRWLIFGDKDNVELHITNMDSGTSGSELEEARASLRAAGVTSLDRTRTIYPVSFEPSDWYKYLLPLEPQKPSQDQLRLMYGTVLSKIKALSVIMDQLNTTNENSFSSLRDPYDTAAGHANETTRDFVNTQIACLTNNQETCKTYEDKRETAIEALFDEAEKYSIYSYATYFKPPSSEYFSKLQQERDALFEKLNVIQNYITQSTSSLGRLIDSSQLAVADDIESHRDDEWLQFEFDSSTYHKEQDTSHESTSVDASGGIRFGFFSLGGHVSHSKATSDFSEKISNANMRIKGELLRVNIKRPWFKPDIFEFPDLTYSESHDGNITYMSPGTSFPDANSFYTQLNQPNIKYKLPEYVTSFLLARKIEMEFSNMASDVVTHTMNEMTSVSASGGFLFFHASVSYTKSKQASHVQVDRTASGMKITIPGAQMIGYYTKVLPKFPPNQ